MAASATMPTPAVASVGVVPQAAVVTLAVHVSATAAVLTTAGHAATFARNHHASSNVAKHASTHAKRVAVLTPPAVAIGLRTAQHLHTHGTVVTTEAHHAKTHDKTLPVRRVVVGKTAAVTTATALALPPVALQATSLHAAPNSLAPATSSPMALQAKALPASVAAHVS